MRLPATVLLASLATTASAATLPADFETTTGQLAPISAYFGGVGGITISLSAVEAYSGQSQAVEVLWQPDQFFTAAGAVVGDTLIPAADLDIPANPSVFSLTVVAPLEGVFSIQAVLGEDDNGDGVIDPIGDDDEWTSPRVFLDAGRQVYNFDLTAFTNTSEGGNDSQNFDTTIAMSLRLVIETRVSYPGGMVDTPATYLIDHVGLYTQPQTLTDSNPADLNGDGVVNTTDLADLLAAWGASGPADLDGDGVVGSGDLAALIAAWG